MLLICSVIMSHSKRGCRGIAVFSSVSNETRHLAAGKARDAKVDRGCLRIFVFCAPALLLPYHHHHLQQDPTVSTCALVQVFGTLRLRYLKGTTTTMSFNPQIISSAHPVAAVSERRRHLVESRLEQDVDQPKHFYGENSPSLSYTTIELSVEGAAQSLVYEHGMTIEARTSLASMICDEVSQGKITIPGKHFNNVELRRALRKSFSATSTSPVPELGVGEERERMLGLLSMFILLKAPTSSLCSSLQGFKASLVAAAVDIEREKQAELVAAAEKIKEQINEFLRANGEPDFPFDDVVEYPDPEPTFSQLKYNIQGDLATLQFRKPEVWAAVLEKFDAFGHKALKVKGYIKRAE